jgi:hypothetical protein
LLVNELMKVLDINQHFSNVSFVYVFENDDEIVVDYHHPLIHLAVVQQLLDILVFPVVVVVLVVAVVVVYDYLLQHLMEVDNDMNSMEYYWDLIKVKMCARNKKIIKYNHL